ncbi:hypothetical protein MMC26_000641 [Xylographa opegraphella]|nr:hypothetical protein [Xylographa opegraphella]
MRFSTTIIFSILAASTCVLARHPDSRGIYAREASPYIYDELDLYVRDLYEEDLSERDFYERDLDAKDIHAREATPAERTSHALFRRTTVKQ